MQEMWVQSLGWEDPLEKGIAAHSSTLAWRIPWTEEPGGLQSMGLQRVGHDWVTDTFRFQEVTGSLEGSVIHSVDTLRWLGFYDSCFQFTWDFQFQQRSCRAWNNEWLSCSQCGLVADNLRYSAPWRQGLSALIGESPTKASGFTSKSDRNGTWSQNSAFDFWQIFIKNKSSSRTVFYRLLWRLSG